MAKTVPQCRPVGAVFELDVHDEEGRLITFRVQVDARGVSCWTPNSEGGRLTAPELFAACCQAAARDRGDR